MMLDDGTAILLVVVLLAALTIFVGWYIISELRLIVSKLNDLAVLITVYKKEVPRETEPPNV